ncbi:MAG: DUF1552 domain-containing protein, partial [Bradymonadaceae bacterium]
FNRLKTDANLPKSDRKRLERHADKVRDLEHDIDRLKDRMVCDGGFPKDIWGKRSGRKQAVGVDEKWMYEDLRAELMADLMVRSMACGRTNIGTLCYSLEASRLNIRHMGDQKEPGQIHGANHSSHWPIMSAQLVIKWHVAQWVKLLERLAEEPAPPPYDDESMLDRTAAVLLFESGAKKYAPNKVKTHTTDNMVALVGGKAGVDGKRLRGNVHVDAGNNAHPCSAQMSAMEAVGVQQDHFGELPWESHSELFEQV